MINVSKIYASTRFYFNKLFFFNAIYIYIYIHTHIHTHTQKTFALK